MNWSLNYIECDGVRVPEDWTLTHLKRALAKRRIRFGNEREIMAVFGDAVKMKQHIENEIDELRRTKSELEIKVADLKIKANISVIHQATKKIIGG